MYGRAIFFWKGGNPYFEAPASFSLSQDDVHSKINHPHIPSIYPPLTMLFFGFLSAVDYSIYPFKVLSLVADMGVLYILTLLFRTRKRSMDALWFYALHPLPILESASSGHIESWAIFALMFALYRETQAKEGVFWIWMGGMLKLLPLLLLPAFWRRSPWIFFLLLVLSLGLLWVFELYSLPQGLVLYAQHWSFHSSFFALFSVFFGGYARAVCMFVAGILVCCALLYKSLLEEKAFWICAAFVLFSPTVHPWYLLWVLPLSILCMQRSWMWLYTAYPLFYVAWTTFDPISRSWDPPVWPQIVTYVPFLILLVFERVAHIMKWNIGRKREPLDG